MLSSKVKFFTFYSENGPLTALGGQVERATRWRPFLTALKEYLRLVTGAHTLLFGTPMAGIYPRSSSWPARGKIETIFEGRLIASSGPLSSLTCANDSRLIVRAWAPRKLASPSNT